MEKLVITINQTFLVMIRVIIINVYIIFFIIAGQELAFGESNPHERSYLIRTASNYLYTEKFDSVFQISSTLQQYFPSDPVGYFIAADVYGKIMRDYRVRNYETEFDSLIDLTIQVANSALKNQQNSETLFLLGVAKGYKSLFQFRRGMLLEAVLDGVSSIEILNLALEENPNFVDPLLGLSLYEYAKLKAFRNITFRASRKEDRIISNLEKVSRDGKYVSNSALYSLQNIYYETGRIEEAIKVNDLLHQKYPLNPAVLYNRALLLELSGNYKDSLSNWNILLNRIENMGYPSFGYQAECHIRRAKIFMLLKNIEECKKEVISAQNSIGFYDPSNEIDGTYSSLGSTKDAIKELSELLDLN